MSSGVGGYGSKPPSYIAGVAGRPAGKSGATGSGRAYSSASAKGAGPSNYAFFADIGFGHVRSYAQYRPVYTKTTVQQDIVSHKQRIAGAVVGALVCTALGAGIGFLLGGPFGAGVGACLGLMIGVALGMGGAAMLGATWSISSIRRVG